MRRAQFLPCLSSLLKRLHHNVRGAVAPLFLVSAAAIFAALLGGMDLARHAGVVSQLQSAIDGAALAMGRYAAGESDAQRLLAEARRYFGANFPAGYQGSVLRTADLRLTGSPDGGSMTLSIEGRLPLLSTGFLDVSAIRLAASSTVTLESSSSLEVVFSQDTSTFDGIIGEFLFPSALARLGQELLQGSSDIHIGLVPYSDVVNVGRQNRQWVARWLEHWPAATTSRATREYTSTLWNGCVAEPQPWRAPDLSAISAHTPNSRFVPLFVRAQTSLHETKPLRDKGWQLEGLPWPLGIFERVTKEDVTQPSSFDRIANSPDRRLWVRFEPGPGNSAQSRFDLYSAHEPEHCPPSTAVRFLDNDIRTVPNALSDMARVRPYGRLSRALPPAGLLWSWRMLSPAWRNGNGWNASHLPIAVNATSKAIVLITFGNMTAWDRLQWIDDTSTLKPLWDPAGNGFAFRLNYHTTTCLIWALCDQRNRQIRTHQQTVTPRTTDNDWQYPVTSLAMPDPFTAGNTIDFRSWPTVRDYTRRTCDAIKAEGISIFVLTPSLGMFNRQDFEYCASGPSNRRQIYTFAQMDALREALLSMRSESTDLRLVATN